MKNGVYYWQAGDRLVYISYGRVIDICSEGPWRTHYDIRGRSTKDCVMTFTIEKCRSRTAKLKTLVFLGEL